MMERLKCDSCGRFIGKNDKVKTVLVNSQNWPPYPGDQIVVHEQCEIDKRIVRANKRTI